MRKYDELGDLGCEKTVEVILRNYWFPGLRDKAKVYIANWLKCIAFSPTRGRGKVSLILYRKVIVRF